MILQLHTPKGIVEIDSDTVTDTTLESIGIDRQMLNTFLAEQPRDLITEIDALRARVDKLEEI